MRINKIKKLLNEIKGIEYHNQLNPEIWNNFMLIPEVKNKLMDIANNFIEFMEINKDSILNIVFTGSLANYNYNKFSDIDLHIIVDFDKIHKDCPIVGEFFNAERSLFNKKHNITIKDYPVEVYVEDSKNPATSSGVFSIKNNTWIKKPEYKNIDIDDKAVKVKHNYYVKIIKEVLKNKHGIEEAENILNKIYNMRKSGLSKGGEYSVENLVFKLLRNENLINKLKGYIDINKIKS